jgi:sugar phosphate permease
MSSFSPALAQRRFSRVVPIAFITYSLAFLDRVNYGFGVAGGMARELGMSDQHSALASASFFLGYLLLQIPAASYAANRSAKRIVFWALLLWGGLSTSVGLISSVPLLILSRFLLGAAEGVVMPAMLVYLTHWFTRAERSRANTFLILGNPVTLLWASAISGYLIQSWGWRAMFIAEGIPSIIWAFIWLAVAQDHPRQAWWISGREAEELEQALDAEQQNLSPLKHYSAAFADTRVLLLGAQLFFWSVGLYGLVLWLPQILSGASKLGIGTIGLLSAAPYLCGVILMVVNAHQSDRSLRRSGFVWPYLLAAAVAFGLSYVFGMERLWLAYSCLVVAGGCVFAGYGPFFAIVPEIVPRSAAGQSMALINACGAVGGFSGTYLVGWLNAVTGGPGVSFLVLAGSLGAAALCMLNIRER